MDWNSYLQAEGGPIQYGDGEVPASAYGNPPSPLPRDVVQPSIGKFIGFMAIIYFIGEILPQDAPFRSWTECVLQDAYCS